MRKLIPKYEEGQPIRVFIQNTDPDKKPEEAYVYVDKDGRPVQFNPNTGEFAAHRGSPNGKIFWTTKADTTTDYRSPVPTYDQSVPFENPKNREQIATNREIAQNNNYYHLFTSTPNEILRDWQLQNSQGSAKRLWYDNNGTPHWEFGEQGMSAADPAGKFYVESVAAGKLLQGLDIYSKLLARNTKKLKQAEQIESYPITVANKFQRASELESKRQSFKNYRDFVKSGDIQVVPGYIPSQVQLDIMQEKNFQPILEGVTFPITAEFANKIVKPRLKSNGIDIQAEGDPIIVNYTDQFGKANGHTQYNTIERFIDSRSSVPVFPGYYTRGSVVGTNWPNVGLMTVDFSGKPENFARALSTAIHEQSGHNTQLILEKTGLYKLYDNYLKDLITNTKYKFNNSSSYRWQELRSTIFEYIYKMSKKLPNGLNSTVDEFNQLIDNMSNSDFLSSFMDINAYSQDYIQAIGRSLKINDLIKGLKNLIKTAPSILLGISGQQYLNNNFEKSSDVVNNTTH